MALHHFSNLNETLKSLYKAMKPNSILIIREHDVLDKSMALFLDFVHAFYMTINSNEETIENFSKIYSEGNFTNYKSLDDWIILLKSMGFELINKITTSDIFNSGYLIMKKV